MANNNTNNEWNSPFHHHSVALETSAFRPIWAVLRETMENEGSSSKKDARNWFHSSRDSVQIGNLCSAQNSLWDIFRTLSYLITSATKSTFMKRKWLRKYEIGSSCSQSILSSWHKASVCLYTYSEYRLSSNLWLIKWHSQCPAMIFWVKLCMICYDAGNNRSELYL